MASSSSSVEIVVDTNKDVHKGVRKNLELRRAAVTGDCRTAKVFFEQDGWAVRTAVTQSSETALMLAIRSPRGQRNEFVKELVHLMSPEDLALTDSSGFTTLHVAAAAGNVEVAKLLVEKNANLPNLWNSSMTSLPVHRAAECGQGEMFKFLLAQTKENLHPKPFEDDVGVKALNQLIANELFDAALLLVKKYPMLAWEHKPYPLQTIAMKRSVFQSLMHTKVVQFCMHVRKLLLFPYRIVRKLLILPNRIVRKSPTSPNSIEPTLVDDTLTSEPTLVDDTLTSVFILVRYFEKLVLPYAYPEQLASLVHEIYSTQRKIAKRQQALELVKQLCSEASKLDHTKALSVFGPALLTAASAGTHEVVEEILASFPSAIVATNNDLNQNLFHLAIVNRHVNVFNLIYQVDEELRRDFLSAQDKNMNNGLHLVGYLDDEQKLELRTHAAGAALQMQRELLWFREVERFLLPQDREQRNKKDETPAMVFAQQHKDLVGEGEKWMKDTATSCTIVAALVATVAFTSAITVPGGNNNNGQPNFFGNRAFRVFAISDGIALYASTASVLTFLTILTSRYAPDDFLYALPGALIIGLITIFVSLVSMIIAFGATFYLTWGDGRLWILAPLSAFSLYIVVLAWMQFRLHLDLMRSTYGFGNFRKQSKRIPFQVKQKSGV